MNLFIRKKLYTSMADGKTPISAGGVARPWGHRAVLAGLDKKSGQQYVITYLRPFHIIAAWIFRTFKIKV